jgi:hypothetical protein
MFKGLPIWKYASYCSTALQDSKENTRSLLRTFIVNDIPNFISAFKPLDCPTLPEHVDLRSRKRLLFKRSRQFTCLEAAPSFFAAYQPSHSWKRNQKELTLKVCGLKSETYPAIHITSQTPTIFNMRHHISPQTLSLLSLALLSSPRSLRTPTQFSRIGSRNTTSKVVIGPPKRMASMKAANRLKVAFEKNVGPSMGCW